MSRLPSAPPFLAYSSKLLGGGFKALDGFLVLTGEGLLGIEYASKRLAIRDKKEPSLLGPLPRPGLSTFV